MKKLLQIFALSLLLNSTLFANSNVTEFVTRFYTTVLDRNPDITGLNNWVEELESGAKSGSDIAYGFIFSTEFKNRDVDNEEYLDILYKSFFNRDGDVGGIANWMNKLNSGESKFKVLDGFLNSKEFANLCKSYGITPIIQPVDNIQSFVYRFYKEVLERYPDKNGMIDWSLKLSNEEISGADIAQGFIFSPEFKNRNLNNNSYVNILYKAFFNRLPDSLGFDNWIDKLNNGASKSDVLNGFLNSKEFSNLCNNYGIRATSQWSKEDVEERLGALIPTAEMLSSLPKAPIPTQYRARLPISVDLSPDMPPVRSQGGQGSCVAWAVGYYLKSYHEHLDQGTTYGTRDNYSGVYSPAFLYNIIKVGEVGNCSRGSYISDAFKRVENIGIAPWKDMPYSDKECDTIPSQKALDDAPCAKITSYGTIDKMNIEAIKYYLSVKEPIVIGIGVYDGFYRYYNKIDGEYIYQNTNNDGRRYGGHAITIVGYDDNKNAFKIVNSWGKTFANDGYLWIDYDVFKAITNGVYVSTDEKSRCNEKSVEIRLGDNIVLDEQKTKVIPINKTDENSIIDNIQCSSNPNNIDFSNTNAKIVVNMPKYIDIQEFSIECIAYNLENIELDSDIINISVKKID
ncbi:Cysteine protease [hydrothermal vent metagenome]|uniref:Cysteine protease n=1 Tax=hydrothermal vent metagenome TaxID=652676 RepID=A0A1W1EIV8_9ZZZZ